MSGRLCDNDQRGRRSCRTMIVDVKQGYSYAPSQRPVNIEIHHQDFETSDEQQQPHNAAQNWTTESTLFHGNIGAERAHVDRTRRQLAQRRVMEVKFEIKACVPGTNSGMEKEVRAAMNRLWCHLLARPAARSGCLGDIFVSSSLLCYSWRPRRRE